MKDFNEFLLEIEKLNKNREYDKVIELLSDEVLIKYNNADLYSEIARAFGNTKKYNECKEASEKALQLNSKNSKAFSCLGNLALSFKEYDKAVEYFFKVIEIDSNDANAFNGLGNAHCHLNEFKKAIEYFLKAIEIDPNYPSPYNGIGNAFNDLKEYEKAIENYFKAIDLDENFYIAYNGLGNVFHNYKEYEKAVEYYFKVIEIDPDCYQPYFNLGNVYFDLNEYQKSKENYSKFLSLNMDSEDFFYKSALSKIKEIDKIIENSTYKKANIFVDKIKELLKFKGDCVTHYTGISFVQFLVLKESPLRLSEGSFLNDTSEGQELFSFLDFLSGETTNKKYNKESFTRRPFIGSFVDAEKNNDLTLWRMYGKELLEEAKGCSITLNANELVSKIKDKICPDGDFIPSSFDNIEFYRVAYRNDERFEFAGATSEQNKELSDLMKNLFEVISEFKDKPNKLKNEEIEVIELLNQIAYLFKSTEYKYENEIRLIIKDAIGFERKIDFDANNFKPSTKPLKVYIELVPIHNLLSKITIGPKVDKAEEWASTFYYQLANKDIYPEIEISTLPFK